MIGPVSLCESASELGDETLSPGFFPASGQDSGLPHIASLSSWSEQTLPIDQQFHVSDKS
jgi:hypothetical protein